MIGIRILEKPFLTVQNYIILRKKTEFILQAQFTANSFWKEYDTSLHQSLVSSKFVQTVYVTHSVIYFIYL